jgi:hypothetical protein
MVCAYRLFGFGFDFDFDGEVGAPDLTELAANAVLGPGRNRLVLLVEFQDIFRAEGHADAAPLAPILVDVMLLQFRSGHFGNPLVGSKNMNNFCMLTILDSRVKRIHSIS